jgi:hypothetical protein
MPAVCLAAVPHVLDPDLVGLVIHGVQHPVVAYMDTEGAGSGQHWHAAVRVRFVGEVIDRVLTRFRTGLSRARKCLRARCRHWML